MSHAATVISGNSFPL